jgi:hypothetical protein
VIGKSLKHSDIRFCQRATELPYRQLVRYRDFTIAIAATSQSRQFPASEPVIPEANGVLHGASTYGDGTAQPMLPVSIRFLDRGRGANELIGSGRFDTHSGYEDRFYCLRLTILDPGHKFLPGLTARLNAPPYRRGGSSIFAAETQM